MSYHHEKLKDIAAGVVPSEVLYESGTTAHIDLTGYYAIQAIEDCTFTTLTVSNLTGDADLATKTLSAGQVWYIKITAFTLAGGSCFLYKI